MIWLTDKEREENARRDRESRARGFNSSYDEREWRDEDSTRRAAVAAAKKLTTDEVRDLINFSRRNRDHSLPHVVSLLKP